MQIFWNKASAYALYGVRRGRAARDHRRGLGLNRKHLQLRPFLFQYLCAAGQVAASADTGDDGIQSIGKVSQNFLGCCAQMHGDIGRVFKLLRHPRAGGGVHQFLGTGDGALHAFFARRQIECCAIGQHQTTALDTHAVGHDQNQFVAFDRGHHGQTDAGIARGGLNDGAAGF